MSFYVLHTSLNTTKKCKHPTLKCVYILYKIYVYSEVVEWYFRRQMPLSANVNKVILCSAVFKQ